MGQTCCRLSTNGNEYRSYDGEDVQVGGQGQAEDQHEGELRRTCSMDLLTPSPHALKCELEEMSFRFIDDTTEDVEDILNDTRKELECQANQEIQKFKTTAKRAADTVVDETKVKLSEATREEVKHFRNEVSSERHKSSKTSVTHVHGDQINIKNTGVVNISTPKGSKISIDNQKLIKDLKERLQQDYKKRLGSIPLSPLVPTINNKLYNFYVQPNISKPKPGTKGQHDDDDKSEVVVSYKDIFWSHNSKKKYADVYLQGEPDSRLNEMFRLSGNTLTALDLRLMGGHLDLTPCRNLRCLYLAFFFEGSSVAIPTSSPRTLVLDNVTPEVEQSALSTLISNSSPLEKIIINKSNDVPFLCRAVESLSCLRYINLNAIDFGNEQISFPYTVTRVKLDYNAVCVDMLKHTIGRIKEAGKDHVVELVMFECTLLEPRTSSAKDLIKEIQKSRELSVSSIDISMEWPNPEDIINLELQTNSNQRCSELLLP
ncbi:uncharacterized protein LOC128222855 isoform X2 [Mya arenaria]|uniref:uncharacterized protein LOC128222855 isoform X2 n=1 Tax=Mya arenaria TaxID=6604 RepID=UPI0022E49A27|nr:uncharacterized protein LOC128222855 isoform X2 [Mya arenaria]